MYHSRGCPILTVLSRVWELRQSLTKRVWGWGGGLWASACCVSVRPEFQHSRTRIELEAVVSGDM